ncbi:MAG: tetraacyldisaccharide 4'-kinase [Proteobacteria bacterium]|nr:tetraacyldisaccharide 4'-kinase [Pseudomonadota bacterium]
MRIPWWEWEAGCERGWQRAALSPLAPLALCYAGGARLHRRLYERGWLDARRLPCRVVSVGGLAVGGSGKTPLASWLAAGLSRRGHRVALASRGYRGAAREAVTVVSDGYRVHAGPAVAGDEAMLLAGGAPRGPVLVGRDRAVVGLRAISAFSAQVLVLDDGFHHHRLARDVEVVTIDGRLGLGNGRVLPRGPLRECPEALSRAHAVGVLAGPLGDTDRDRVTRLAPDAFRFRGRRRPRGVRSLQASGRVPVEESSLETLRGARVGMLAAIARPASFRATLESLGAEVVAERLFRDHHVYRPRDLRGLARQVPIWFTTQKDAIKILPTWLRGADLRVLVVDLELEDPEGLLDWLEARLPSPAQEVPFSTSS